MALVEAGYMGVRKNHPLAGGDDGFWVTEAGKRAAIENSPAPPKVSRGAQRYLDYLAADCSMSFIQYCRYKTCRREASR